MNPFDAMPESHHSNGIEPLLPTHRDSVPAPLSSPVTMDDSIEAAIARPLPMTPPLEVQGGGGGGYVSVSPVSGRYPGIAPLSPSGMSFSVIPQLAMHSKSSRTSRELFTSAIRCPSRVGRLLWGRSTA